MKYEQPFDKALVYRIDPKITHKSSNLCKYPKVPFCKYKNTKVSCCQDVEEPLELSSGSPWPALLEQS